MTPRSSARLSRLSWSESLIDLLEAGDHAGADGGVASAASGLKQMTNRSPRRSSPP
jgi:hypothetical protein